MRYIFLFITLSLILFTSSLQAQVLTGISAKWSDAFNEWTLNTDVEDEEGDLNMRWQMRNDWSEWDYRIGESSGSIRMKWKDDPTQWEIRGNNETVTAKAIWKDDPTEWRISNNDITLTFKSRWKNELNEWELREDKYGTLKVYTNWDNDPRDWNVLDELDEEITLPMKMAMLFIATYHSSPKD